MLSLLFLGGTFLIALLTYIDRNKKRKIKVGLPALRATCNLPKAIVSLCISQSVFYL
nr:putative holin-like toxin [Anaerostipes sp.]